MCPIRLLKDQVKTLSNNAVFTRKYDDRRANKLRSTYTDFEKRNSSKEKTLTSLDKDKSNFAV